MCFAVIQYRQTQLNSTVDTCACPTTVKLVGFYYNKHNNTSSRKKSVSVIEEIRDVAPLQELQGHFMGAGPLVSTQRAIYRNSRSGNRPNLNMLRPTFGQTGDVQVTICIEQRFWTFTCIRVPRFIHPRVSYYHRGFSGIMREVMTHLKVHLSPTYLHAAFPMQTK